MYSSTRRLFTLNDFTHTSVRLKVTGRKALPSKLISPQLYSYLKGGTVGDFIAYAKRGRRVLAFSLERGLVRLASPRDWPVELKASHSSLYSTSLNRELYLLSSRAVEKRLISIFRLVEKKITHFPILNGDLSLHIMMAMKSFLLEPALLIKHILTDESVSLYSQELEDALDCYKLGSELFDALADLVKSKYLPSRYELLFKKISKFKHDIGNKMTLMNFGISYIEKRKNRQSVVEFIGRGADCFAIFNPSDYLHNYAIRLEDITFDDFCKRFILAESGDSPDYHIGLSIGNRWGGRVSVDVSQLLFCVESLVCNSIKYKRDDVRLRVVVRVFLGKDSLIIKVKDNASGMSEETAAKVFDGGIRERCDVSGTGFGLALVSDSIRAQGGSISVKSTLGKGTLFTIKLPLLKE